MGVVVVVVWLAGCTSGGTHEAELAFEGQGEAQDGQHNDAVRCGQEGRLTGAGSITSGQLIVWVTDGDGRSVFRGTYSGPVLVEAEVIQGDPGDWILGVERTTGFQGDYALALVCD